MTVLVGGEAIDAALWVRLSEQKDIAFYNVYGPTECTVGQYARAHRCRRGPSASREAAVEHAEFTCWMTMVSTVPPGAVGEICIGGAGVARGTSIGRC